jgi:2,5-dihydroxypyridine 5,6-dioxygenase
MSQAIQQEMVQLFQKELELCRVRAGETVAVLSAGNFLDEYVEPFLTAARNLGAKTVNVHVPQTKRLSGDTDRLKEFGKNPLSENPNAMEILKSSDMVVDLLVASFSHEGDAIRAAGARMLLVVEDFDTLRRLFPTPEHRARTEASFKRLASANTFRFTNTIGTDVTYTFGKRYKPLVQYGYTADRGRWDAWPAGLVANCAENVEGCVVMNEGDMVHFEMLFLPEPIEFEISGGYVRKIKGGKAADEMRRRIDSYNDPRAYAISHIGWGTHPAAIWSTSGVGADGRSYYGNVLFSLGPNAEFGGDNDTFCHIDLPMRGCSAWVDGEKIIANGRILPEAMQVPGM